MATFDPMLKKLILSGSSYFPQNATTAWKNDESSLYTIHFSDHSLARFILFQAINRKGSEVDALYGFGFCFYCKSPSTDSCYLSIIFIEMVDGTILDTPPLIVWSADRDQPIGESSVLYFYVGGNLVLNDTHGHSIWSTDASDSSAIGVSIGVSISEGNLVLLNQTNGTIWQSFDHPTDTLLLGQRLSKGQQLTSSMSSMDFSSGLFYLCLDFDSLSAYEGGKNQSRYLSVSPYIEFTNWNLTHVEFTKGNLTFFYHGYKGYEEFPPFLEIPVSPFIQLLRFDNDGGLRLYSWEPDDGWKPIHYFSDNFWGECQFPLICGRYGVCQNGQCACPVAVDGIDFFAPIDSHYLSHGCRQMDDPGLQGTSYHYELRDFGQLFNFNYLDCLGAVTGLESEESCKQACLINGTSCMAAFFLYIKSNSSGVCCLVSEVLSIIGTPLPISLHSSSHIKVKVYSAPHVHVSSSSKFRTLPVASSACAFALLSIALSLLLLNRNKARRNKLYLKKLSETLLRFSYNELSTATQSFSQKLGGGGFGLVFKGTLTDGREVAVKRLGNDGQGKKEFLAEVETVGKIHHINLVRLIGFCVENKHLILVYEYMTNGSLEKWIFYENRNASLDWKLRKKIVLDIAKGLAYIHEECVQRIAHLDVKPHNILLDDKFNAKISDFGMSKLIDRGKSQVMTGMRGTLGYLAPEWQGSRITVKADVYSFGILVLEVVSGRKIRDYSQPESQVHLLKLVKNKCLENQLMDIVDSRSEDMVCNCEDAMHMIRLAMWCLHSDYKRRPEMSSVVKVLEGSLELEPDITYNFASIFSPISICSDSNALASNVNPKTGLHIW